MSAPENKAVFLSYASQDSEAARRICEALRAAGVEVWFDQSELRGGDAWDAKIRKQIKECALFVPIISANTQARLEGYFRLEWKLAAHRTHTMADAKPFIVPVCIDDTRDADAHVPEEFRMVQWTRLAGARPTPQFVEHLKRLLAAPQEVAPASRLQPAERQARTPAPRHSSNRRLVAALAMLAMIGSGTVAWQWLRHPAAESPVNAPHSVERPNAAPKSVAHAAEKSAVPDKSIAVLPFENRSAEKDNAYFTDGIHDDILTGLANLHELRVVSRTSVMEYRATTKKIPQIARELGVAYVLEGGVQRVGNSVHITGQLIRAATDEHVWAQSYDRELTATNLFAIQTELAHAIAGELKAALSPQEKSQLAHAPTSNLAAYEAYSKAREIFYARGNDIAAMFKEATPLYERATALDPNFAEAWAGVSLAYSLAYNRGIARTPEVKTKAHDAVQTALRLAPENPGAILTLARYFAMVEGDTERALVESERAAKILPNNVELYDTLVSIYGRQGRAPEALAAARKARELDPRSPSLARSLGRHLINAHRFGEAEEVLRQALTLQPDSVESAALLAAIPLYTRGSTREWDAWLASVAPPSRTNLTFQQVHLQVTAAKGDAAAYAKLVAAYHRESREGYGYAFALMLAGEAEHARTVAAQIRDEQLAILARAPTASLAWSRLALAYAALGEKSAAIEAADRSLTRASTASEVSPTAGMVLRHAQVLAWVGRKDEALKELAQVWWQPTQGRDPLTSFMWAPLKGDPRFEAIRNDPRNNEPLF